jgi:hypothetical protein
MFLEDRIDPLKFIFAVCDQIASMSFLAPKIELFVPAF